jgi:site-specific recombinase XerC
LDEIEPLHVAAYIEALGKDFEKPTVKQHLAAIRMLFDWLVTGQIVATNPAHSVRGPKHVVKTGKTTVLDVGQARKLLDSIDTSTVVGLRDRALISVMTFAFARIGAVVAMRVEDYYPKGKRWWVRLHEKGGKRHEMPAPASATAASTPGICSTRSLFSPNWGRAASHGPVTRRLSGACPLSVSSIYSFTLGRIFSIASR